MSDKVYIMMNDGIIDGVYCARNDIEIIVVNSDCPKEDILWVNSMIKEVDGLVDIGAIHQAY